ncbi:MAG: hypothetical protein BMS9Abin04_025 [Planctomycetia bacterium]|nr:MAG: hypothetical protein BMS9Abin04_025 [Planctomycetia bacterium]
MRRRMHTVVLFSVLFCASGSQCVQNKWQPLPIFAPQPPRVLAEGASAEQIIEVINRNSARVTSYWTNSATITVPGAPPLRASIALEQPRRFRLRAGTRFGGPEVDLGSNDSLFWFWVRRNEQPALYYCRHDQYATTGAWRIMPVPPQWFIDALGFPHFDVNRWHAGPFRRADGNFELRSRQPSPAGDLLRITVVDAARGWVLEQHLFGVDGALLARAIADRYQHDRPTGVWLPTRVRIQIVPAQISLLVELRETLINQPAGDPRELWAKPNYTGYAEVDLARATGGFPAPPAAARPQRPADAPAPRRLSRLPSIGAGLLAQPVR